MQAMPVTSRADDGDLGTLAKLRSVDSLTIVALACLGATCAIQQRAIKAGLLQPTFSMQGVYYCKATLGILRHIQQPVP